MHSLFNPAPYPIAFSQRHGLSFNFYEGKEPRSSTRLKMMERRIVGHQEVDESGQ